MSEARRDYYLRLLRAEWGDLSPRDRKRLERRHQLLFIAIEGVMKHD